MSHKWFILKDREKEGPYNWEHLKGKVVDGELNKSDYVGTEGMEDWAAASSIPDLFPTAAPPPPVQDPGAATRDLPPIQNQPQAKKKNGKKIAFIIVTSLLVLFVVIGTIAVYTARSALQNSKIYLEATSILEDSAEAAEILGAPVEVGSEVNGRINVSNTEGQADMIIPISGPKKNGELKALGYMTGGEWHLSLLLLRTEDGQLLDLLAADDESGEEVATRLEDDESIKKEAEMLNFSSSKYGFEIDYPSYWTLVTTDDEESFDVIISAPLLEGDLVNIFQIYPIAKASAGGLYNNLDELYEDLKRINHERLDKENEQVLEEIYEDNLEWIIDEISYNSSVYTAVFTLEGVEYVALALLLDRDDDLFYHIQYLEPRDPPDDFVDYLEVMLESFRFIEMDYGQHKI